MKKNKKLLKIPFLIPIIFANNQPLIAEEVEKKIQGIEIKKNITVPDFVQYYQRNKRVPSCYVEYSGVKRVNIITFDDADDEDYSNCNKIFPPSILLKDGVTYAVFEFLEEETKGVISSHFFYIKIIPNDFEYCNNSEDLSERVKLHKSTEAAKVEALSTLGCKLKLQ